MKIVHLTSTLDPDAGGPPVVVSRLAAAQAALGHEVAIVGGRAVERAERTRAFLNETPGIDAVEIRDLPIHTPGVTGFLSGGETVAVLDESHAKSPVDVVHLHGLWEPLLVCVARWCRKHQVPYVICPHGMLDY